jgi:hypothetical protein
MLAANEARAVVLNFPKRFYLGTENKLVHPEENACSDKVSNNDCQPVIGSGIIGKENTFSVHHNGSQNRCGKLPTQTIENKLFEHTGKKYEPPCDYCDYTVIFDNE